MNVNEHACSDHRMLSHESCSGLVVVVGVVGCTRTRKLYGVGMDAPEIERARR